MQFLKNKSVQLTFSSQLQSSTAYRGSPIPAMSTDNYKIRGMMRTSTNSLTECMWPVAIYYDDLDYELMRMMVILMERMRMILTMIMKMEMMRTSTNSLTECMWPVASTKSSGLSCCSISHMPEITSISLLIIIIIISISHLPGYSPCQHRHHPH